MGMENGAGRVYLCVSERKWHRAYQSVPVCDYGSRSLLPGPASPQPCSTALPGLTETLLSEHGSRPPGSAQTRLEHMSLSLTRTDSRTLRPQLPLASRTHTQHYLQLFASPPLLQFVCFVILLDTAYDHEDILQLLFLCFSTQINFRHVFKVFAFRTNARLESWMSLVNGCINCALLNAVPNVYLHNWKEWLIQQTKYCNNVILKSVSRRKNKQIKTHETDATWHEAYYSH